MNDRFRFRAWIVEKQEYVFDVESTWDDIEACFGDLINNPKYVVEQCTGLKDKNDNLIYEGDVVKIPDDYETYGFMSGEKREVYFRDGGFRLKPKDTKLGRGHWLEQTSALEIIGNIHEIKENNYERCE